MPIGDLLAQISGEPSPTFPPADLPQKRKADDDLRKPLTKVQKVRPPVTNSSQPITQTQRQVLDTSVSKVKVPAANGKSPSSQNPASKRPPPTTPVAASTPKAPPKKGSFAEILARGKAAQATLGQVGKIQHKRIEKRPTKKEIEEAKVQRAKNIQRGVERTDVNGKPMKSGQPSGRDGKNGVKDSNGKSVPPVPEKKIKKAATATTGYAGTARPRPGSRKPSESSSFTSRREERGRYRGSSNQYSYASDEYDEEEDDDMEEDDYGGYESSDMEAGAFEVDEEEQYATKIARREDAEALAEENQLKQEKEERKRKLMALARKSRR